MGQASEREMRSQLDAPPRSGDHMYSFTLKDKQREQKGTERERGERITGWKLVPPKSAKKHIELSEGGRAG